jgi:cell fate regulator YaaT (PSP1 superfamily)
MCCLTYEYDVYRNLKGDYPKVNSWVTTPSGRGKIVRHNVIAGQVTVRLEDGEEIELQLKDVKASAN